MLTNYLKNRLDRILFKTQDWTVSHIEMVGTVAIPGVMYEKTLKSGIKTLPVLPSDHFGLYAVLQPTS